MTILMSFDTMGSMEAKTNIFTVTPMAQTLPLTAGEKSTGTITIINQKEATRPLSFTISLAPYGVTGDSYDIDLITENNLTMLSKWIILDTDSGTLDPGESLDIHFTADVPADAPAGGQYAAIIISSDGSKEQENEGNTVQYVQEIASIVYGEVAGETVREGSIKSHTVPGFATSPKVAVDAVIENRGNIHEYAKIDLTVTNFLTGEDIFSTEESELPTSELIMPHSERHLVRDLSNLPALGIVNVKETITYLGETSTLEHHLFLCPLWFMLLVAFTVVAVVAMVITHIRRSHGGGSKEDDLLV